MDHTGEGAAAGFITGFAMSSLMGGLAAQAHINMNKQQKKILDAAIKLGGNFGKATDSRKELVQKSLAMDTGKTFDLLLNMGSSPGKKIIADNFDQKISDAAEAESIYNAPYHLEKTMKELGPRSSLLHAVLQFNKAQLNDYVDNMNSEESEVEFVIPGIQEKSKIAGLNNADLEDITRVIQDNIFTKAQSEGVIQDLGLEGLQIPETAWNDIALAAAMNLKGNALDLLDMKLGEEVSDSTKQVLRNRLESFENETLSALGQITLRDSLT